jgi:hypothetical protein
MQTNYNFFSKSPLEKLQFLTFEVPLHKIGTPDFNIKAATRLQIYIIFPPRISVLLANAIRV